jgi:hypothetical protein
MNQNYGFSANYGTALTTTQTANYGTQNPGPTNVTPFMAETIRGEMMGTASDGSSLAAYSPIVHAIPIEVRTPKENMFVPEGTLLALFNGEQNVAQECTVAGEFIMQGCVSGFAVKIPFTFPNASKWIRRIAPTASGLNGVPGQKKFADTVSIAFKSVTRVLIRGHRIWHKKGSETKVWRPGQHLYAFVDFHSVTPPHTVEIILLTDINSFREFMKDQPDHQGLFMCPSATSITTNLDDSSIDNLQGVFSQVFKLGTIVLPCHVEDHNMEEYCYVNLSSTQSVV